MKKRERTCVSCKTVELTFSKSETCSACVVQNKKQALIESEKVELAGYGYKVLGGPEYDDHNHRKYKVLTPCCGSEYDALVLTIRSMIARKGSPPCARCGSRERISAAMSAYKEKYGRDDSDELSVYRKKVRTVSEKTYTMWSHVINPDGKLRGHDTYHLDHRVPISWCFENKIPCEIAGSVLNLQMLSYDENIRKLAKPPENPLDILYGGVLNVLSYKNPILMPGKLNVWPHELGAPALSSMLLHRRKEATRVNARDLELKPVPPVVAKEFFDKNHLHGSTGATATHGLWSGDVLIMAVSIGVSRFSRKYDYEVIRMASVGGVQVRGGASKLFKHLPIKGKLLTFSDNHVGDGQVYAKAGFEFVGETGPGYFWERDGEVLSRHKTQKSKLVKQHPDLAHLTENEIMRELGWCKVFTFGNKRWVKIYE